MEMSSLDLSGCKKRKRGERPVYRFKSFGEGGNPVEFNGQFRENMRALLEVGNLERNFCCKMQSKSFQLEVHRHPPLHVLLLVIEESVEALLHPHCNHCQHIGWGHHMICKKKYHFLLPSKKTMAARWRCQGKCEESSNPSKGKQNLIEVEGHMMHGVFHSNGFGHLLCVNGFEMGSELAGSQIMDFWDRLCFGLQARKVSLSDNSKKKGMEWRLLHGAAHGSPWFGRWGYEFGRGSFGVTETMYNKAIEAIQSIPLPHLSTGTTTPIFSKYQTLSTPNHPLKNLRDLFCFLLDLKPHLASNSSSRDRDSDTANTCRWSAKRVEMAARVIVEALRRAEFRWVTRQQVRDAARAYIGDTGLLDYVLKSLGNRVVGNFLVRRSLNPVTKVLEYSLVDVSCVAFPGTPPQQMNSITRSQLMKDLFYLYKSILLGQQKPKQNAAVFAAIPVAARIILDTKLLIKEYCGDHQHSPPLRSDLQLEREGSSTIYCTFRLKRKDESSNPEDKDEEASKNPPPPLERFILKGDKSTIADLKRDVEERFRDTYLGLKDLAVESIENPNNTVNGSDRVLDAVKPGCDKIVFEANSGGGEEIQYECGGKNGDWEMDCRCGAEGDDGERMICCDICGVWQHSRCVGFPNNEEIPNMFLCGRCEQELVVSPSLP